MQDTEAARVLTGTPCEGRALATDFLGFIRSPDFPCLGAKSALARGRLRVVVARDIRSGWNDLEILPELVDLVAEYRADPQPFRSFAVLFEAPSTLDEPDFEHHMWERLQSLSDKDEWNGSAPDPRVSSDPENPHFSLSFGGEAFFVVGLHPGASRPARRFRAPALVFNLHDQFERLRAEGRYDRLREAILERDRSLAGSINPMLQRFGESSEARQYSGRPVGADWRCPFRAPGRRADPR